MLSMKWTLILSAIYLLQSCDSFDTRPTVIQKFHQVPDSWHTNGKISAVFNGKSQYADFMLDFNQQNYKLTLTTSLGLGQILIQSNSRGLKINDNLVFLNFEQWMLAETGWYFPIYDLAKIAFNQPFINKNWQLKILSRQPNNLPKTIYLSHQSQNINIKLIFKNIHIN